MSLNYDPQPLPLNFDGWVLFLEQYPPGGEVLFLLGVLEQYDP